MSTRILVVGILALFVASACADEFDAKPLDEIVGRALSEFKVPGAAVVVVKDDKIIYLKGFGVRAQGSDEKVTPDTLFAIASCTKAFCTTLLAMQVDEGKLKWDDLVRTHLDYFRLSDELAERDVTVRDLVCHRSGMPRHDLIWTGYEGSEGSEEIIKRWCKANKSTSLRSTFEYSNVPFTTAGVIAGKIDKTDWMSATKHRIFGPLKMVSSVTSGRDAVSTPNHATPHYRKLDGKTVAVPWDYLDSARAAGSIGSTARDLGNWLRFQLGDGKFEGKQVLYSRALKETREPQMLVRPLGPFAAYFPTKVTRFPTYGLGWFVHDYRGRVCMSHGGTLTGFRAQCMMVPDERIGVFVLGNLRPSYFTEAVSKSILDQLLGASGEDWVKFYLDQLAKNDADTKKAQDKRTKDRVAGTKPSLELEQYTGTYTEPGYGAAKVSRENEILRVQWAKMAFRLEHYHFDTFTAIPIEPADRLASMDRSTFAVAFRLGANGKVESLKLFDQEFRK